MRRWNQVQPSEEEEAVRWSATRDKQPEGGSNVTDLLKALLGNGSVNVPATHTWSTTQQ
jgi:hypothetical protein